MVIGIISSTHSHIQRIKDMITPKYKFVYVTEKDVVSAIGIGKLVNINKAPLLDSLQNTYGNVIISGDAFWSEPTCRHLLTDLRGVLLIDTTLPKSPHGQYWGREGTMEWVMQFQSKRASQHNGGSVIYLDVDNSQFQSDMTAMLGVIQNCYEKRDVVDMSMEGVTMEDVIKRAMKDLGIEPSVQVAPSANQSVEQPEEVTSPEVEKTVEGAIQHPVADQLPADQLPAIEVAPEKNPTSSINSTLSNSQVYLKMKDGTMVLFIPTDVQLPVQIIDGVKYHTMVFTAPDLGNTGLQPLKIQNVVTTPKIKRQSILVSTAVSKTPAGGDLQQLVAQKVQLDQSIKNARAEGDETTVNELRKQRRLVRRQINAIGGEATHVATSN